jgi:hypothetical protein
MLQHGFTWPVHHLNLDHIQNVCDMVRQFVYKRPLLWYVVLDGIRQE